MIKAVIFDFDGVIHDTVELQFKIHKEFHPDSTIEWWKEEYFSGNVLSKVAKTFNQKDHDRFRELEYEAYSELQLEREIKEELKTLAGKYELYIITSNSIRNIQKYFENSNFTGIFKEILAAETHRSKEEKFKILFEKYGLNNKNSIFVTDTLGDLKEANKVGIKSIGVTFGIHNEKKLKEANPFAIVSDFKKIKEIVGKL